MNINTGRKWYKLIGLTISCRRCAVIFALKRNEAKRKRNFYRFEAKKSVFFAYFASMRNVEIWSETKMERSENKTKKKQKIFIFTSKRNKAKRKRKTPIIFASKRNEAKQKRKNAIIFASKRNGGKIFSLRCEKKCFFPFFASEAKGKLN
jgi:hypothetical protein